MMPGPMPLSSLLPATGLSSDAAKKLVRDLHSRDPSERPDGKSWQPGVAFITTMPSTLSCRTFKQTFGENTTPRMRFTLARGRRCKSTRQSWCK